MTTDQRAENLKTAIKAWERRNDSTYRLGLAIGLCTAVFLVFKITSFPPFIIGVTGLIILIALLVSYLAAIWYARFISDELIKNTEVLGEAYSKNPSQLLSFPYTAPEEYWQYQKTQYPLLIWAILLITYCFIISPRLILSQMSIDLQNNIGVLHFFILMVMMILIPPMIWHTAGRRKFREATGIDAVTVMQEAGYRWIWWWGWVKAKNKPDVKTD